MDGITLHPALLPALLAEAARHAANECCGLLLGTGAVIDRIVPTYNVAAEPARHFEIDPQALIAAHRAERAGGPRILGYYHSHPTGRTEPSATDQASAAGDGKVWAIIAGGDVTFWRDDGPGFSRLSITLAAG